MVRTENCAAVAYINSQVCISAEVGKAPRAVGLRAPVVSDGLPPEESWEQSHRSHVLEQETDRHKKFAPQCGAGDLDPSQDG